MRQIQTIITYTLHVHAPQVSGEKSSASGVSSGVPHRTALAFL